MIRSKNVNTAVDYALGKDDYGIYFRINEAFRDVLANRLISDKPDVHFIAWCSYILQGF